MSAEAFRKLRLTKREEVDNAMIFAIIFMKARYDIKYLTLYLKKEDKAFLKLYYGYIISSLINRKLS